MIWLTWRQHRRQLLFTALGLVALAALMLPTGLTMRRAFTDAGLSECVGSASRTELCDRALDQFNNRFESMALLGVLFVVLPLVVGLFWGAPLVAREVEQGTHRFAWTQGVSRRRWALVKFGLVGVVALAVAAGYGLGMSWWAGPLSQAGQVSRFDILFFDMQGTVPVGYTVFAVALGVFAGVVWPKVLPAMAVTLFGFVGVRIVLTALARPHYLPAQARTIPVQGTVGEPGAGLGDWIVEKGLRDASGRMVMSGQAACPPADSPGGADCAPIRDFGPGVQNWQLYQPADRFWLFQGIETAIFVALAVLLLIVALRQLRRIA